MDGDENDSESLKKFLDDVKVTAKNGIVLNGALAWVDIQSHTTAVGVRQDQMVSLFTMEEIEEAIEDLWGACGGEETVLGTMPKRNNVPNKAKNLVDDLFKAFIKLEEVDKKPAILATSVQMRTIRPYNLGEAANVHPTDVMERVKLLEECISNQNKTIMQLVMKIDSLAHTHRPVQQLPPLHPPAVGHNRVQGAVGGVPPQAPPRVDQLIHQAYDRVQDRVILTPSKRKRVADDHVEENQAGNRDAPKSWAGVVNSDQSRNHTPGQKGGRSHWRQKSLLVNGVSNDSTEDKSFAADVCLVAGGVSKNATSDKLTDYLKNKGLNILKCELLTTKVELARTLSFKVTIKADDFEKAKNPNIWPYRVVVRKFVNFRRREVDEFAPQGNQVRGVHRLEQGQHAHQAGPGHVQPHQAEHGTPTSVHNRFDVQGFREEGSH